MLWISAPATGNDWGVILKDDNSNIALYRFFSNSDLNISLGTKVIRLVSFFDNTWHHIAISKIIYLRIKK